MPGGTVTDEMVKGWLTFLDEAQAILKGQKLVPFWRGHDERGVNLRRVFTEPTTLDVTGWAKLIGQSIACTSASGSWNTETTLFLTRTCHPAG